MIKRFFVATSLISGLNANNILKDATFKTDTGTTISDSNLFQDSFHDTSISTDPNYAVAYLQKQTRVRAVVLVIKPGALTPIEVKLWLGLTVDVNSMIQCGGTYSFDKVFSCNGTDAKIIKIS
jgi:hypothetical protein